MNGIRKTSGRASLLDTANWLRDKMLDEAWDQMVYPCDADDFDFLDLLDTDPATLLKGKGRQDSRVPWETAPWEKWSNDKYNGREG